jgi:hypothetical protein
MGTALNKAQKYPLGEELSGAVFGAGITSPGEDFRKASLGPFIFSFTIRRPPSKVNPPHFSADAAGPRLLH